MVSIYVHVSCWRLGLSRILRAHERHMELEGLGGLGRDKHPQQPILEF